MRILPMPVEGESVYENVTFPAVDWCISDSKIACLKKTLK